MTRRARHGEPMIFLTSALRRKSSLCLNWPFGKPEGKAYIEVASKSELVQRVVCERVNGPPPRHGIVQTTCKNHRCINRRHLYWANRSAEARCHHKKLTPERVRNIRLWLERGETQSSVARLFSVSPTLIGMIKSGERWAHIK